MFIVYSKILFYFTASICFLTLRSEIDKEGVTVTNGDTKGSGSSSQKAHAHYNNRHESNPVTSTPFY